MAIHRLPGRRAGRRSPSHGGSRRRSLGFTLVVGIILLLVFALVFSVAFGTRRITTNAVVLHTLDESLRSATVARAQVAIASHAASVDREFGTNSTGAIELSIDEAVRALGDLRLGLLQLEELQAESAVVTSLAADFTVTSEEVIRLLEAHDSRSAQTIANDDLDRSFRVLQSALVEERDRINAEVSQSDLQLGRIGNIARFLVGFIVPTAVILIYRELTRRQQRQQDLERRLAVEQSLGKARDEFVANASHELRTPLTSIYGLALMLEEDPVFRASETAPELLDMIISEAADLSRMVEDLLTTARLDAGALHYTFEDVEVTEEVEEVVGPMLRAGLHIHVECVPGIVRADRLRFRQVLRNLLSNARKYGGPEIRVEGRVEEGKYVCAVADNGEGIPADLESRLFQRYIHQGHQPLVLGSVGLGLSIVRALAEGQGGAVHYDRRDGWTRFVFTLPLVAAVPGTAAGTPGLDPQAAAKGYPPLEPDLVQPLDYDVGAGPAGSRPSVPSDPDREAFPA